MRKRKLYFALIVILFLSLITTMYSFLDKNNITEEIEEISYISENFFNITPLIILHYNIPSNPKSGLKSIEGLDPKTNSRIFLLEFDPSPLYSNKSSIFKKISTQRFYSPSGILLLRSRLKDDKINFRFDFLGDKSISIRDTKIKNTASRSSKFEIFLEGKKMVDITLRYGKKGQIELSPQSRVNGINQISCFLKKIKGTILEKQLKEFAWAHSFMPKNDSTLAAIFAGNLTGIISIPYYSSINAQNEPKDSPFWDYTECLEASCSDCGGLWVMSPIVGCVWEWDILGIGRGCYVIQSLLCAKEFLQL